MTQIILFFAISICTTVGAHLLFKKGVLKLGELNFSFSSMFHIVGQILQNVWIILGVILFGISFFTWLFILSKMQLNIAYPIIISVEAILVTIISWFLFHEYLSWPQILGIVAIIIGIFLIYTKGAV